MRHAYDPAQKESRRQAILDSALRLFQEVPYADLRMADLAKRVGLGKGTLYLSFPTKEALFLAVLHLEMAAWFQAVTDRLARTPADTEPRLAAEILVQELLSRPMLPKLHALLYNVLERNVPLVEAVALARFLKRGVMAVGEQLERVVTGLPKGRGAAYVIRFNSLVMGNELMSARPPEVRGALREADSSLFDFNFERGLRGAAVDLMAGMLGERVSASRSPGPGPA